MVKLGFGLIALCLFGCAHPERASIVVEPGTAALSQFGALRESIGIETLGGVFTPILAKGCKVPCAVAKTFSTADDGQGQILLHLYRGDAPLAKSIHYLGTFQVTGIAPMPRGAPSIRVEFSVDTRGISLTATDNEGKSRLSLVRAAP